MLAQSRPADQVIVVDDGSDDDPAAIVARYPGVEFVRQANAGLSAARNTGLAHARHEAILFLDADDRLCPDALALGVQTLAARPGAAFVYGGHRRIDAAGTSLGPDQFDPSGNDPYADLLRGNLIGMHGTVLYDRAILAWAGGFDTGLAKCEDYDVYLRLAQDHTIGHHCGTVAEYRIHGANMSGNSRSMLQWVETVRARHARVARGNPAHARAWAQGGRIWREYYHDELVTNALAAPSAAERRRLQREAWRIAPRRHARMSARNLRRRLAAKLPAGVRHRIKRAMGRSSQPPVGHVDLGDFDRVRPVSFDFGFDRGTPVDRFYIEQFLAAHAGDIAGRVLEIGDAAYSRRFGRGIEQQDVLHIDPEAPEATIAGDLSQPGVLPEGAFDCLIITQTLHLIYDMAAAMERLHASLKPGGVLLLTVPGISPIDRGAWGDTWYWSLTEASARKLAEGAFGPGQAEVTTHGNAYAATCFVQGLALEEVRRERLGKTDRSYPVVVTVRAVKRR